MGNSSGGKGSSGFAVAGAIYGIAALIMALFFLVAMGIATHPHQTLTIKEMPILVILSGAVNLVIGTIFLLSRREGQVSSRSRNILSIVAFINLLVGSLFLALGYLQNAPSSPSLGGLGGLLVVTFFLSVVPIKLSD